MADVYDSGSTPLRQLGLDCVSGCQMLAQFGLGSQSLDGSEEALRAILSSASDLGSLSDELAAQAATWAERYHLSRSRANLLRALEIPSATVALDVGARYGAVTRYLGERCATVDALEPSLARASVARLRTGDLANVEVFVGSLGDVPPQAAYDLVVVVGVLEYAGQGAAELTSYQAFVSHAASLLAPGGSLVIAIENSLGAKYLAGAPEDHTVRSFDSLEGYPYGTRARAFSRGELASLLRGADLEPVVLTVFPDYKLPRVVIADELFERLPALAWRLPQFPSPDWLGSRPRLADERRLWRTAVNAGLGPHLGNSLLALARKGGKGRALWPKTRLACWFNTERRAPYATATELSVDSHGSVHFTRRALGDGARERESTRIVFRPSSSDLVEGHDLLEELEEADPGAVGRWLGEWARLVEREGSDGALVACDLVPHNLIVGPDGDLHPIDLEWWAETDEGASLPLERGIFWLAVGLTARTPPGRWRGTTVRDVACELGEVGGLEPSGAWLAQRVRAEAEMQAEIHVAPRETPEWSAGVERWSAILQGLLDRRLDDLPLGLRAHERLEAARAEIESLRSQLGEVDARTAEAVKLAYAEAERRASQDAERARDEAVRLAAELATTTSRLQGLEAERDEQRRRERDLERQFVTLGERLADHGALATRLADSESQRAELSIRVDEAVSARDRLAADLAETRVSLQHARDWLAVIHASKSWRLTGALRLGGRLVRGLAGALPRFPRRPLRSLTRTPPAAGAAGSPAAQAGLEPSADVGAPDVLELSLPTSAQPVLSVVIPAYGQAAATDRCLVAIVAFPPVAPFEVLLVDDCSPDDMGEALSRFRGLRVLRTEQQGGFVAACNHGIGAALGEYVVLLNNDTEVESGWLDALYGTAVADPSVGVVGAKVVNPDRTIQEAGGIVWSNGDGWHYGRGEPDYVAHYRYVRDVDYVSGACLLVRKKILDEMGGLDGRYAPAYYEDTDLAFTARSLGYRVVYQPNAVVVHHEGTTHGTDVAAGVKQFQGVNRMKFADKWKGELRNQQPPDPSRLVLARDRRPGPRVLVVDHMVPIFDQDAGSLRMYWFLRLLTDLGCVVTFLPDDFTARRPYSDALEQLGIEVLYGPLDPVAHLRALGNHLELCLLSRPYVACRHVALLRELAPSAAVLYDTVDLHYVRERRRAQLEESASAARVATAYRELELGLARACDGVITVTEAEGKTLRGELPGLRTHVIPTVHPVVPDGPGFLDRHGLLFVGGFRHPPNVDAVEFLVGEVMPRLRSDLPGVRLSIVGNHPPEHVVSLRADDVEVLGWVEDLEPLYRRARVVVAPLRYGAGMKGKITESLSYGVPVVTTPVGAEGIGLEHGRHALVAEGAESIAEGIIRLYADAKLWETVRQAGRRLVEERYSPDPVRARVAAMLQAHGVRLKGS